jgi:F-type H+-transporting ATPase subunit epsilon
MAKFLLEIITPVRQAFSEEVDMVVVPTTSGVVGVLAHHEPLFSSLTEGEIKISSAGKDFFLAIGGGFMEINKDKVSILVSRAVHADELNEAEIKKAQDAAREIIKNKAEGASLMQAQAMLRRSSVDLKVLHRRKPRTQIS